MKTRTFPFRWYPRPRPQLKEQPGSPSLPVLPMLPAELWRKIIGYTTRMTGANSLELEDPFSTPYENEEYPDVDLLISQDRKNLSLVCSDWHSIVREICAEYLVIRSDRQLKRLLKKWQRCPVHDGRHLGEITKRIDIRILGEYSVPNVVRLIRATPNLLIYNNHNSLPVKHPQVQGCTPVEVMRALVESCGKSLRRIEWSDGESPRYQDLAELCNRLPKLMTLRLMAIYSYPPHRDGAPPMLFLPRLKTLSLGDIPATDPRPQYSRTWDPFLQYLSANPMQLPLLERFECNVFPIQTITFFTMHGHKILFFRTTAWSVQGFLPATLDLCPRLDSLVLAQGVETIPLPSSHPTLRRICIFPLTEDPVVVPRRLYDAAVLMPLDGLLRSLEGIDAPYLVELRIRNIGAYTDLIDYSAWLRSWWVRWNIRGVQFRDKVGTSYRYVQDPQESLLNSIRG